jgi:hypothetical protein
MALVGSPEWVLSLNEREQYAWLIALGEQKGGEFDYKRMVWSKPPQPEPVFAILAEGAT